MFSFLGAKLSVYPSFSVPLKRLTYNLIGAESESEPLGKNQISRLGEIRAASSRNGFCIWIIRKEVLHLNILLLLAFQSCFRWEPKTSKPQTERSQIQSKTKHWKSIQFKPNNLRQMKASTEFCYLLSFYKKWKHWRTIMPYLSKSKDWSSPAIGLIMINFVVSLKKDFLL